MIFIALVRRRIDPRRLAFVITGAIAMTLSLAMFSCVLATGASPHAATLARLATSLPVLYVGYSRYMLGAALAADRARLGRTHAELRMVVRVAGAIGASVALKLLLEPPLTAWLATHFGHAASAAPLVGDLGYGPLVTYLILTLRSSNRPSRDSSVLS